MPVNVKLEKEGDITKNRKVHGQWASLLTVPIPTIHTYIHTWELKMIAILPLNDSNHVITILIDSVKTFEHLTDTYLLLTRPSWLICFLDLTNQASGVWVAYAIKEWSYYADGHGFKSKFRPLKIPEQLFTKSRVNHFICDGLQVSGENNLIFFVLNWCKNNILTLKQVD